MATTAIVWEGFVYIGTAGSDPTKDGDKIGEVKSFDIPWDVDMVEVTSQCSEGHREYIPGLDGATCTLEVNYLKSDVDGQDALWTYFQGKDKFAIRVNMDEGSNDGYGIYGDCYLSGMPVSSSTGDAVTMRVSIQFTGEITYDADSA